MKSKSDRPREEGSDFLHKRQDQRVRDFNRIDKPSIPVFKNRQGEMREDLVKGSFDRIVQFHRAQGTFIEINTQQQQYDTHEEKYMKLIEQDMPELREKREKYKADPFRKKHDADSLTKAHGKRKILQEWNEAMLAADDIKRMEVYRLIDKEKREIYEKELEVYNTLEEKYSKGLRRVGDLKHVMGRLDALNEEMRFEQKVYDLTEMTSEQFSSPNLHFNEEDAVKKRVAKTAESIGWRAVMERATEVIQQINDKNCRCIVEAIGESGDRSLAKDLLKIFSNENINLEIRWEAAIAIGNLRSISEARNLVEMLPNEQLHQNLHHGIHAALNLIESWGDIDRTIINRLIEIKNNDQTGPRARETITRMLGKWAWEEEDQ